MNACTMHCDLEIWIVHFSQTCTIMDHLFCDLEIDYKRCVGCMLGFIQKFPTEGKTSKTFNLMDNMSSSIFWADKTEENYNVAKNILNFANCCQRTWCQRNSVLLVKIFDKTKNNKILQSYKYLIQNSIKEIFHFIPKYKTK